MKLLTFLTQKYIWRRGWAISTLMNAFLFQTGKRMELSKYKYTHGGPILLLHILYRFFKEVSISIKCDF